MPDIDVNRLYRRAEIGPLGAPKGGSLYRAIIAGTFPAPVYLSKRAPAWHGAVLAEWLEHNRERTWRPTLRLEENASPQILDLRYIAGLFDGEGTIAISKRYGKANKGLCVQVGVTNTHEGVVRAIWQQFGGFVHTVIRDNPKHRICFQWCLTGSPAASFLVSIRPFLVVKRPQAFLALKFQELRIKRTDARASRTAARRAELVVLRERVQALNHGRVTPTDEELA